MKITFILPCVGLSGGVRIIRKYASGLVNRGHDVTIIAPFANKQETPSDPVKPLSLSRVVYSLNTRFRTLMGRDHLFGFEGRLIHPPSLHHKYVPDGDIVIASAWQTAEWVATYPPSKGKKVYFIQHYETWSGPIERIDATWKLPMVRIVLSKWLKELGEKKFCVEMVGPIKHNPVDHDIFYPDSRKENNQIRVGMLYSPEPWKGFDDGLKAFEIAKSQVPNIKLVLISARRRKSNVPRYAEFYFQPTQRKLRRIYSSCDIWLCSSLTEGFHLPPFEAMACGCALVSTKVGGVEDICENGVHAMISEPGDPQKLGTNLLTVIKDEKLRRQLSENGIRLTRMVNWEDNINAIEEVLLKVLSGEIG